MTQGPDVKSTVDSILEGTTNISRVVVCVGARASATSMRVYRRTSQAKEFAQKVSGILGGTPAESLDLLATLMRQDPAVDANNVAQPPSVILDLLDQLQTQLEPSSLHRALTHLPLEAVITTNYDTLVERALQAEKIRFTTLLPNEQPHISEGVPVIKLYGSPRASMDYLYTPQIIEALVSLSPALESTIRTLLATRLTFFIGYSPFDSTFREIYNYFSGYSDRLNWVALMEDAPRVERYLWEQRGLRLLDVSLDKVDDVLNLLGDRIRDRFAESSQAKRLIPSSGRVFVSAPRTARHIANQVNNTIRELGLRPVSLYEDISAGKTIFERFEKLIAEIDAAVVILDNVNSFPERLGYENTLFELGYLTSRLGWNRVIVVYSGSPSDLPSTLTGIHVLRWDNTGAARHSISRELESLVH
jgi:predicted nucleotide-binding protein